jgi:carbonic anhydrase
MENLKHLFENNRAWAKRIREQDPDFFAELAEQQSPAYLWIGCSDSRVPANQIVGLLPGELFVHRNVANLVVHTDLNCLSVMQFAIDLLHVRHIIVCGHYGCSGVRAVLQRDRIGLSDNWLRHVGDVHARHEKRIANAPSAAAACDRLCELNVIEQALHVSETTVVLDAWARGQTLSVHGWVYGIDDGLLRDLRFTVDAPEKILARYRDAIAAIGG